MRPVFPALVLAALVLACVPERTEPRRAAPIRTPVPKPPPRRLGTAAGDAWHEWKSAHFTVVGNGTDDQVRAVLFELVRVPMSTAPKIEH